MQCKSMTGFGRAVHRSDKMVVKAELRAVNHRFVEFNIKLPREWTALEESVRNLLSLHIFRGRVDLFLSGEYLLPAQKRVSVDWGLIEHLVRIDREVADKYLQKADVPPSNHWLTYPDVLRIETDELNVDALREDVLTAVKSAIQVFVDMRSREGTRLAHDMLSKLVSLRGHVQAIEEGAPSLHSQMETKLRRRVAELAGSVDEHRLMTEIAILLERQTIDEELVRLKSHIDEYCATISQGSPVGRKLDFLVQEMHREVNTIGSKANDLNISKAVVESKVIIEQLREQTQNLE